MAPDAHSRRRFLATLGALAGIGGLAGTALAGDDGDAPPADVSTGSEPAETGTDGGEPDGAAQLDALASDAHDRLCDCPLCANL